MLIKAQCSLDDPGKRFSQRNAIRFSPCEGARLYQVWQDMPQKCHKKECIL